MTMAGITDAVEVSLGGMLCVRRAEGSVLCAPGLDDGFGVFAPVLGLDDAVSLTQGEAHACAQRAGGGAMCWGYNGTGQLGDGTLVDRAAAVTVVGLGLRVQQITAGDFATCARLDDGSARCWGRALEGQLGDGVTVHQACGPNETCSPTPVVVAGLDDVDAISGGLNAAMARRGDGRVLHWGWGFDSVDGYAVALPMREVPGARGAVLLHAGYLSNYAILPDGDLLCWGLCAYEDLQPVPIEPAAIDGLHGVVDVASGWYHACALLGDGRVQCWGDNHDNQLGDGTTTARAEPRDVIGL